MKTHWQILKQKWGEERGNSKASEGIKKNQKKGGKAKLWEGLKKKPKESKKTRKTEDKHIIKPKCVRVLKYVDIRQ